MLELAAKGSWLIHVLLVWDGRVMSCLLCGLLCDELWGASGLQWWDRIKAVFGLVLPYI